eukprot:329930-Prymnesium_polylepis.1
MPLTSGVTRVRTFTPLGRSHRSHTAWNMLRETDGTWDNGYHDGYTHAWTQVRVTLRPRGIVHRKAPRV